MLIFLLLTGVFNSIFSLEDCMFEPFFVKTSDASVSINSTTDTHLLNSISFSLSEFDIRTLISNKEIDYEVFPYSFKIQFSCNNSEKASMMNRHAVFTGLQLSVDTTYKPAKSSKQLYQRHFIQTSLVYYQTDYSCSNILCDPGWVFPFYADGVNSLFPINIHSEAFSIKRNLNRFNLKVSGFDIENDFKLGTLSGIQIGQLINTSRLSQISVSTYTVLLPFSRSSHYVISENNFKSYFIYKPNFFNQFMVNVCGLSTHPNSSTINSLAVFDDRIWFATPVGIISVQGNFNKLEELQNPVKILDICASDLIMSKDSFLDPSYSLIFGSGNHAGHLYYARVISRTVAPVESTLLPDVCYFNTQSCKLLSAAISAKNKGVVYALVKIGSYSTASYRFMTYEPVLNGTWNFTGIFTNNFTRTLGSLTTFLSVSSSGSEYLHVEKIVTLPVISNNIFLIGNEIIISDNAGSDWYILNTFNSIGNITQMNVCPNLLFAFTTSENEMWGGSVGNFEVYKLYPSASWNFLKTQTSRLSAPDTFTINNIYCTTSNQVYMVVTNLATSDLQAVKLPLIQLLVQHSLSQLYSTSTVLTNSSNGLHKVLSVPALCNYIRATFTITQQQQYTKIQRVLFSAPQVSDKLEKSNNVSLLVYHSVISSYINVRSEWRTKAYTHQLLDSVQVWKRSMNQLKKFNYYVFQNKLDHQGVHVDLNLYKMVYQNENEDVYLTELPSIIYLDRNQIMQVKMEIIFPLDASVNLLNQTQIMLTSTDPQKLSVSHRQTQYDTRRSITYLIDVQDTGSMFNQSQPGYNLENQAFSLIINQNQKNCFESHSTESESVKGTYHVNVKLGCPPSLVLLFDYSLTRSRLNGMAGEVDSDCLIRDPERPCFYFSNGFYPYFRLFDQSTGDMSNFTGRYTLKIVGGSSESINAIKLFTEEEIISYNRQNQPVNKLIWGPDENIPIVDDWPVYSHDFNSIRWLCRTGSPCDNILPKFPSSPEYYFLVEFSNKFVDNQTNCDFTSNFVLHIHGLPIHPTNFSLVLTLCAAALFGILACIYYLCLRNDKYIIKKILICRKKEVSPIGEDDWNKLTKSKREPLEMTKGEIKSKSSKMFGSHLEMETIVEAS